MWQASGISSADRQMNERRDHSSLGQMTHLRSVLAAAEEGCALLEHCRDSSIAEKRSFHSMKGSLGLSTTVSVPLLRFHLSSSVRRRSAGSRHGWMNNDLSGDVAVHHQSESVVDLFKSHRPIDDRSDSGRFHHSEHGDQFASS